MRKITLKEAKEVGDFLKVNFKVISVETLKKGMIVELEHGICDKRTNISGDNLIITAKIALAHLVEFPDYYRRLEAMEGEAEEFWKKHNKPDIFL
jgi:hypothetical protein